MFRVRDHRHIIEEVEFVPCYRLFFRDPAGGRFTDSEVLEDCEDDRTALRILADRLSDRDVELWERERLVAVLRAPSRAA